MCSVPAEMSGTVADISLVHWKQQWLENGTLYFHVSMSSAEQLSRATPPSLQEPSEIVEEQMHILHISVMVSRSCRLRPRARGTWRRGREVVQDRLEGLVCTCPCPFCAPRLTPSLQRGTDVFEWASK